MARKESAQTIKIKNSLAAIFEENERMTYSMSGRVVEEISVDSIIPNPYQPRKEFDEAALNELADSIKENGVFSPILLTVPENGIYTLVAGERRLRASKLAGKTTIPAIVESYTKKQLLEVALLENLQREDLSPIEIAASLQSLIQELEYTQEEVAKRVGKSREYVANMLRLLRLPQEVQQAVTDTIISAGHAKVLLTLESETLMIEAMRRMIDEKMSVRKAEQMIRQLKKGESEVLKEKTQEDRYGSFGLQEKELQDIFPEAYIKQYEIHIPFTKANIDEIMNQLKKIK